MANKSDATIWTSGRRKTAVARVKMAPKKGGEIMVNGEMTLADYFPSQTDRENVLKPFQVAGRDVKGYEVSLIFSGGGKKAQIDAAALGIAKALEEQDPNLRPLLKDAGLLTRDPRMKERKKPGLKRARKAPQFSKR